MNLVEDLKLHRELTRAAAREVIASTDHPIQRERIDICIAKLKEVTDNFDIRDMIVLLQELVSKDTRNIVDGASVIQKYVAAFMNATHGKDGQIEQHLDYMLASFREHKVDVLNAYFARINEMSPEEIFPYIEALVESGINEETRQIFVNAIIKNVDKLPVSALLNTQMRNWPEVNTGLEYLALCEVLGISSKFNHIASHTTVPYRSLGPVDPRAEALKLLESLDLSVDSEDFSNFPERVQALLDAAAQVSFSEEVRIAIALKLIEVSKHTKVLAYGANNIQGVDTKAILEVLEKVNNRVRAYAAKGYRLPVKIKIAAQEAVKTLPKLLFPKPKFTRMGIIKRTYSSRGLDPEYTKSEILRQVRPYLVSMGRKPNGDRISPIGLKRQVTL